MNLYTVTLGLAFLLFLVYVGYWLKDRQVQKAREAASATLPHDHPWQDLINPRRLGGANNGGAWRNTLPKQARNDEFAGVIPGTCGQIRPGEWQCNCAEPENGCLTLKELKSKADPPEEKTNRRAAIMAQRERNKNKRSE